MCAQPVEKHWFISLNGKRYGPYTFAAITEAAAKGVIDENTSVWRLGWVKWHPAGRVPGLLDNVVQEPRDTEANGEAVAIEERGPVDLDPSDVPGLAGDQPAKPADRRRMAAKSPTRQPDEDDEEAPTTPTRQRDRQAPADRDARRAAARPLQQPDTDDDRPLKPASQRDRPAARDALRAAVRPLEQEDEDAESAPPEPRRQRDRQPPTERGVPRTAARPLEQPDEDDEENEDTPPKPAPQRSRQPPTERGVPRVAARLLQQPDEDDEKNEDTPPKPAPQRDRQPPTERGVFRAAAIPLEQEDEDEDGNHEDAPSKPARQRDRKSATGRPVPRKAPDFTIDRLTEDDGPDDTPWLVSAAPEIKAERRPDAIRSPEVPPQLRTGIATDARRERRGGSFVKPAVVGVVALILVGGAAWGVLYSGLFTAAGPSRPATGVESQPQQLAVPGPAPVSQPMRAAASNGLPNTVATLPAVQALERNDPVDFGRFVTRFLASSVNAQDDEMLSLARTALRKSIKKLLANASGDTLLDITDTYLNYMKALQAISAESCVALSDESKGAKLTSNLAKDFPILFIRDMAVLEQVAATDPKSAIAPLSAERAQPFLEKVFNTLRQLPVQRDLLGRDKLTSTEFPAYCTLVISFYESVLALPREDKINLLRYLYATAAADGDDDVPK